MSKRFTVASFVVALAGATIVAFAPLGQMASVSGGTDGRQGVERITSVSLVSFEGFWVLGLLAVPVAIAALPMLFPRRGARIASAVLLWVFCVLGLASIGLFFVPAAVVMTVSAMTRDRQPVHALS